ncbi:hypothetical protein AB0K40_17665 [Nonomuraea bangladeshensis]|uniref:Uncharacterized protein n=1 Tax=Nonomuraea bangladeshensis TaxID=404385 RepID=A0ABV3H584_9ACTN
MDDESGHCPDLALARLWPEMAPEERLRLLLATGEQPPAELTDSVKRLYDQHRPG